MKITEHGSLDLQKLLGVMSEILSDRYKVRIAVTASMSGSALSSGENVESLKH